MVSDGPNAKTRYHSPKQEFEVVHYYLESVLRQAAELVGYFRGKWELKLLTRDIIRLACDSKKPDGYITHELQRQCLRAVVCKNTLNGMSQCHGLFKDSHHLVILHLSLDLVEASL